MSQEKYRVIQWATGNVGRQAIRGVVAHPELELVGCWVHSPEKVGTDAGVLAGTDPIGVAAMHDAEKLLATDADCVVYSPLLPDKAEVLAFLRSGKNVVTPLGWFYLGNRVEEDLATACREHDVTLHGIGLHPGGITEKFPLLLSGLSRNIRHVRAEEFSDIRAYEAEFVVREIMMFGKLPEQAADSPMLSLLSGGFFQSLDMIVDTLGFDADAEHTTKHETAVATAPIETPVGRLDKGTIAAQRFTWQATVGGVPVATARVNWLMGEENLSPAWNFGPQGERFEVEVEGEPSLTLTFHGMHPQDYRHGRDDNPGLTATAMQCVNSVPAVCDAAAGLLSLLDLPPVAGRAAVAGTV
jgi:hypothetical protein